MIDLENKFRRFTFFLEMNSKEDVHSFFKNKIEKLDRFEFINIEVYAKENQCFLVVDVLPKRDILELKNLLDIQTEPLERIYELDQINSYTAQKGQLKPKLETTKRFVWTLLLEEAPELIAEYKKAHSMGQAWPEITQNMKQVGVLDMEIYLKGNQAFLIMDTETEFDLEKAGPVWQNLPREKEWQEYVAKFQRTSSESSIQEKWLDMERIDSA